MNLLTAECVKYVIPGHSRSAIVGCKTVISGTNFSYPNATRRHGLRCYYESAVAFAVGDIYADGMADLLLRDSTKSGFVIQRCAPEAALKRPVLAYCTYILYTPLWVPSLLHEIKETLATVYLHH